MAVIADGSPQHLNDPGRSGGKHNRPDRNHPIDPLRRRLKLGFGHISTPSLSPNDKLTDDEERASDARIGTCG
jgi:hypothetical protein